MTSDPSSSPAPSLRSDFAAPAARWILDPPLPHLFAWRTVGVPFLALLRHKPGVDFQIEPIGGEGVQLSHCGALDLVSVTADADLLGKVRELEARLLVDLAGIVDRLLDAGLVVALQRPTAEDVPHVPSLAPALDSLRLRRVVGILVVAAPNVSAERVLEFAKQEGLVPARG